MKQKNRNRNVDQIRALRKELDQANVKIGVLVNECQRLVDSGLHYGAMSHRKATEQAVDNAVGKVRTAMDANLLQVCLTFGGQEKTVRYPVPKAELLKGYTVGGYVEGEEFVVMAVEVKPKTLKQMHDAKR